MKKINLLFLIFIFLFSGCVNFKGKSNNKDMLEYEAYYKAIKNNETFKFNSKYYSINAEVMQLENGKYTYYIFVDNPKIAMYDIKILAINEDVEHVEGNIESSSIGIFTDKKTYSLIPFQVYKEAGYYKGLVLNGESDTEEVKIKMIINWYNLERDKSYREFISFTVNKNGIILPHDDLKGGK